MPHRAIFWTLAALAVSAAAWQAFELRWTCDDAFISFRYAQHFAEGKGLVFNLDPTEPPVEGYTNFAWTMWLALGVLLGCSDRALENWSIAWGIVFHAGTVALLAVMAARAAGGRVLVPIAALSYAAIHHAASLAPAGLETALFTLLGLAMLRYMLALRCAREAWLLGFLGVLAAMTRPDGALFVAAAGLFVAYDSWRRRAPWLLLGYALPFALVFVPYLLWRHTYYGFWVPNTFFAKSAGFASLALGWRYLEGGLLCYWPLLLAFAPLLGFLVRKPDLLATISPFLGRRPWLAIAAFVLPYLGFVVWVGGDFMFARFLIPVLPALLLGFDLACLRWHALWLQPPLAALLVVALWLRQEPPGLLDHRLDVSDNRAITMQLWPGTDVTLADIGRGCGEYLQPLFAGLDVRLGIAGAHANLAYRSRAPVAVECAAGLTDAFIARIPVAPGGKRGHDRPWPLYPQYLLQRRLHIMFELSYGAGDPWRDILFPSLPVPVPAKLVTWDRELMRELKRRSPALVFTDFEKFLDDYLGDLPGKGREQVAADYAKFRPFYFAHNADPERQRKFEDFLR
ncbi:MAG: glycosyltransferase family 39 protein [Planctomycetes bacterium]|jgi:hypothetical protein|nr:glycosyltransferase family 39 protein [Planctomycetota bacterium]